VRAASSTGARQRLCARAAAGPAARAPDAKPPWLREAARMLTGAHPDAGPPEKLARAKTAVRSPPAPGRSSCGSPADGRPLTTNAPHGRLSTPSSCTTECSICTRQAAGTDDLRGAHIGGYMRTGHGSAQTTERDRVSGPRGARIADYARTAARMRMRRLGHRASRSGRAVGRWPWRTAWRGRGPPSRAPPGPSPRPPPPPM